MATGPLQDKERQVKSSAHGQSKHQGGQRECSHVEGQGSRKGKIWFTTGISSGFAYS